MRGFHSSAVGGVGEGTLRVLRGSGPITSFIGRLAGLPPSSDGTAVRLEVRPVGNRERWIRSFDRHTLATLQSERDGLLVEQFPIMRFGIEIVVDGDQMVHILRRCWVGPIPIPLWLAPRIDTTTKATPDGWRLYVSVALPLLGRIIEYEGNIRCG